MKPIQLGRMKVHKIYEMESPTPLLFQLPGVTAEDLARLSRWYAQPDEITADPETSFMTFAVHSWVIELDGLTILVDTCDGNHKHRSIESVNQLDTRYLENLRAAGFAPVAAFNPYWDRNGVTFEDPDGYRIVFQHGAW